MNATKRSRTETKNIGVVSSGQNTDDVWEFEAFSSDSTVAYIYLTPPTGVSINPTKLYIRYAACGSTAYPSVVQGYDGSLWIDLYTLVTDNQNTSTSTPTLTGDTFYTEFRLKIYRRNATYNNPKVNEWQITAGTIKIE